MITPNTYVKHIAYDTQLYVLSVNAGEVVCRYRTETGELIKETFLIGELVEIYEEPAPIEPPQPDTP